MAQKTIVKLIDDIDGGEATGTVTFALDGVSYEIDLNDTNAAALRDAVVPWASAARRTGGTPSRPRARGGAGEYDPKAVRAWATSNRVEVPSRGRIPTAVVEQYKAAGN